MTAGNGGLLMTADSIIKEQCEKGNLFLSAVKLLEKESEYENIYDYFKLFLDWAAYEWQVPVCEHALDHSLSHSLRHIDVLNRMFEGETPEDILAKFGDKYLVLLLIACFTHDIGMQEFFYLSDEEFENKHPHLLNKDDKLYVRILHPITAYKIYRNLYVNAYFVPYIARKLKIKDLDLKNNILRLIRDWSNELAIMVKWHNKPNNKETIVSDIRNSIIEKNICELGPLEESLLLASVGFLQIADALDMDRKRLGRFNNNLKALGINDTTKELYDTEDMESLYKKFRCYLIDKVEIEITPKNINVYIETSYSPLMVSKHRQLLDLAIRDYTKRLEGDKYNDARSMVQSVFGRKAIRIHIGELDKKSKKDPLPDGIYEKLLYHKTQPKHGFKDHILDELNSLLLNDKAVAYIKLFSGVHNLFYGGVVSRQSKKYLPIESVYFDPPEWPMMDITKEEKLVEKTPKFLRDMSAELYEKYRDYIDASKGVRSELYLPLKTDGGYLVGYLNIHYEVSMNEKRLKEESERIKPLIKHLPDKIRKAHIERKEKFDSLVYKAMKNNPLFDATDREFMRNLYKITIEHGDGLGFMPTDTNKFCAELEDELTKSNCLSIREKIVDVTYLKISPKKTLKILKALILLLNKFIGCSVEMNSSMRGLYLSVNCKVHNWKEKKTATALEIAEYFKENTLLPVATNAYGIRFAALAKLFVFLHAGRIEVEEESQEDTCIISFLFPLRTI